MSLAGFKKQINKANQYVSEKIGGAHGTLLDSDFVEMEKKMDTTVKLVDDLISNTQCLLQPNPASRLKMNSQITMSKIRGQAKSALYPQPEGILGESMADYGEKLGYDSDFGECLRECGEAYKHLADVKYSLEDEVKQNFLEPLHHLQTKDLKEVLYHRKKLSGRRLDYDCKRRKKEKGGAVTDEEINMAAEKFEESKQLAENAMANVLENDVEQISQLAAFIESQVTYHRLSMEVLQSLSEKLEVKKEESAAKPRVARPVRKVVSNRDLSPYGNDGENDFGSHLGMSPLPSPLHQPNTDMQTPCCRALYDFEPENEGELAFNEGDMIKLVSRIDENWLEGQVHGQNGYFPDSYVEIVVPL